MAHIPIRDDYKAIPPSTPSNLFHHERPSTTQQMWRVIRTFLVSFVCLIAVVLLFGSYGGLFDILTPTTSVPTAGTAGSFRWTDVLSLIPKSGEDC